MATYTTHLNLEKPATSENFNLAKINSNWDKIDAGCALKTDTLKRITSSESGTDFDSFPAQSIVWANNQGGTYSNAPGTSAYHVITVKTLSTHGFQVAVRFNGTPVYLRTAADNTWGDWKSITFS